MRTIVFLLVLIGCGDDSRRIPADTQGPVGDASTADANGVDALVATDAGRDLRSQFGPLIAAVEADIASSNATGASVAVWMDDEVIWVGGFGVADGVSRVPDEETQFMIGSGTKRVNALLLLQRIAQGETTLDATVGDILPDLFLPSASSFPRATLHELLTHQGGLFDELGEFTTQTTDGYLRSYVYGGFAREAFSMAPPGLFHNYSNLNYAVSGLITETLAGIPWADLATRDVFDPLGMTRTVACCGLLAQTVGLELLVERSKSNA